MFLAAILITHAFVTTINAQQPSVSNCPTNLPRGPNLQVHGNKCYQFVLDQRQHWVEAKERCVRNGGNLVEIDNMDEEYYIMNALKSLNFHGASLWIGLNDRAQEGAYVWSTGRPAAFFYWAPGQPSFFHTWKDCVILEFSNSGHWADHHCEFIFDNFSWICQYQFETITSNPATIPFAASTPSNIKNPSQTTAPTNSNSGPTSPKTGLTSSITYPAAATLTISTVKTNASSSAPWVG